MKLANFIPTSGIWLYVFIALILLLLIQVLYYLYFFLKLGREVKKSSVPSGFVHPALSVIICAKNESVNLKAYLSKILDQDYPNQFEVIVVNDASEDNTELVLSQFKEKYKHLYYTTIPYDKKFRHGKKLAMTIGIKAAKNNHLVFTDADCMPASNNWLKLMSEGFSGGKEIVLGYGPYEEKKGFLNFWIRFDAFYIASLYFSFALRKNTYMGVGRNMAYTKELFYKHEGFKKYQHILSGDDDLFIRDAASSSNVAIVTNPEAFTYSIPANSFKEWRRQKLRHLTTSPHYKKKIKALLGIEALSRQLFWGISMVSIFFSTFVLSICIFIFIKVVLQLLVLKRVSKQFGQKDLLWGTILLDFILPLATGILLLGRKRQAKNNKWT